MNPDSALLYERIADGLAASGYACTDLFLSAPETEAIRNGDEFQSGLLTFKRAGTGKTKQIAEEVRGDYIQWIDRDTAAPAIVRYLDRLNELIVFLNRSLFLSLKDYEVHATVYPAGTFYKRHLDQFKTTDHRKLSVILYLNENWREDQGGQLRMYLRGGPQDIYPVGGRLVCFRSDAVEHEVLPGTRDRLSITGWILDTPADHRSAID